MITNVTRQCLASGAVLWTSVRTSRDGMSRGWSDIIRRRPLGPTKPQPSDERG